MSQRTGRSAHTNLGQVTRWLIRQAAHRAPQSLVSRLEEEWLADLACRSSIFSELRFAVGCCWASLVIGSEFPHSQIAAASGVSAGGVVELADRNFGYFSLRSATLFLIAGLHAALFYGLITTLSHTRGSIPPPDLQNAVVHPLPPVPLPPPTAGIQLDGLTFKHRLVIDVPTNTHIDTEAPTHDGEKSVEPHLPSMVSEPPPHLVQRVAGGPGTGFPQTADFYPSHSIRLGEEGLTTLRVCVDPRGRLTSAPTTVRGSGSSRLDEAALKLAQAGSGHYRASTEDGLPVSSCYAFGVRFQLKK